MPALGPRPDGSLQAADIVERTFTLRPDVQLAAPVQFAVAASSHNIEYAGRRRSERPGRGAARSWAEQQHYGAKNRRQDSDLHVILESGIGW